MSIDHERKVDPIQEMSNLIHQYLVELNIWGYKETFCSQETKSLIYDSQWCRVNFTWGGWDAAGGNSINIYYGRLHAPNESAKMVWNGEECHAWHRIEQVLHFLDGRSPVDSAKLNYSVPLIKKYYEESFRKEYHRRQPEWLVKMHAEIWRYYGKGLFEVFDLRQPVIWDQYRDFLKHFYDNKGRPSFIKPPMDKVC